MKRMRVRLCASRKLKTHLQSDILQLVLIPKSDFAYTWTGIQSDIRTCWRTASLRWVVPCQAIMGYGERKGMKSLSEQLWSQTREQIFPYSGSRQLGRNNEHTCFWEGVCCIQRHLFIFQLMRIEGFVHHWKSSERLPPATLGRMYSFADPWRRTVLPFALRLRFSTPCPI